MTTWLHLINPFFTAAKNSFAQALKISTYHDAQLKTHIADSFFASIYASYHVLHLDLAAAYSLWKSQEARVKGNTLTVVQLLKLLCPEKINAWEHAIIGVYPKASPQFVAIFPAKRIPFNSGSKESRIAAVGQLATSLNGIPALASVKLEVDDFHAQLITKRQQQLGNKGTTGTKSKVLDRAIEVAMIDMFANFGLLLNHFKNKPSQIEPFFNLEAIRNPSQSVFKKTVRPEIINTILQRSFTATDTLTITNNGSMALEFYLAQSKMQPGNGSPPFRLEANSRQTIPVTDLGDIDHHFLNVYHDGFDKGHCVVEL